MANDKRGEFDLELCGEAFVLRFSLGSLRKLKSKLKMSLHTYVATKGGEVDPDRLYDIFEEGLKREGSDGQLQKVPEEELNELITAANLDTCIEALTKAMGVTDEKVKKFKEAKKAVQEGDEPPLT